MVGAGLPPVFRGPLPDDDNQSIVIQTRQRILGGAPYLVHLEKTSVHFPPSCNSSGNSVQLRRMFVERPTLDLMNSHNRQEVQVRRW